MQTAVDLYEEKSRELIHLYVNGDIDVRKLLTKHHNIYYDIKEMEKQQIIDAANGYSDETIDDILFEQYYNETFINENRTS